MANDKITQLPETTSVASNGTDVMEISTNVAATPTSNKIKLLNLLKQFFLSDGTFLSWSTIADGQFLKRSGTTITSAVPVTTTGSPANAQLTQFSGASTVTTADATAASAPIFGQDAGSTDTYACNLSPAPSAYVTGTAYRFKANTANTGAATINFNSLGAKTIKKVQGGITTDLSDNDIRVGQWVDLVYDGTNMQMQSTLGNAPSAGVTANPTVPSVPYLSAANVYSDSPLFRKDANSLEQRNSTTQQNFRVMHSYTDANNYDAVRIYGDSSFRYIQSEMVVAGSPAGAATLYISSGTNISLRSDDQSTQATATWDNAGAFKPGTNDSFSIGNSGQRWLKAFIESLFRNIITNTNASYSVLSTDTHLIMNVAGTCTVTLGSATIGREITIRTITNNTVVSASSNVIPLAGGSAGTAILAATAGKWAYLVADGTNWQIQMSN